MLQSSVPVGPVKMSPIGRMDASASAVARSEVANVSRRASTYRGDWNRGPGGLPAQGYRPQHRIRLFDATYYVGELRCEELLLFFVAYVLPSRGSRTTTPRIFFT